MDDLIASLRARAADPERRTDVRPNVFDRPRRWRSRCVRLTSEQRAAMGLPEVGWERVVWGGIGLDEDTPQGG